MGIFQIVKRNMFQVHLNKKLLSNITFTVNQVVLALSLCYISFLFKIRLCWYTTVWCHLVNALSNATLSPKYWTEFISCWLDRWSNVMTAFVCVIFIVKSAPASYQFPVKILQNIIELEQRIALWISFTRGLSCWVIG